MWRSNRRLVQQAAHNLGLATMAEGVRQGPLRATWWPPVAQSRPTTAVRVQNSTREPIIPPHSQSRSQMCLKSSISPKTTKEEPSASGKPRESLNWHRWWLSEERAPTRVAISGPPPPGVARAGGPWSRRGRTRRAWCRASPGRPAPGSCALGGPGAGGNGAGATAARGCKGAEVRATGVPRAGTHN